MTRSVVLLAVLTAVTSAQAEVGPPRDIPALSRGAGRIVVARIADVHAHFETNRFGDQLIVSNAVLEVLETWKGQAVTSMEVAVEGGTVGDLTLRVSDMPEVRKGERAVFFLDEDATRGTHTPRDRGRGILKLDDVTPQAGPTLDDVRGQVRRALSQRQGGR